jgi:hypothetical protein
VHLPAALVGAVALAYREGDDAPQLLRKRAWATATGDGPPGALAGPGAGNGQAARGEVVTNPAH